MLMADRQRSAGIPRSPRWERGFAPACATQARRPASFQTVSWRGHSTGLAREREIMAIHEAVEKHLYK